MNTPDDFIRFACGKCGAKLKAKAGAAGTSLACPKCKSIVQIPAMAEADDEDEDAFIANLVADEHPAFKPSPPPRPLDDDRVYVSDWKPPQRKGLKLAWQVGFVVLFAGGIIYMFASSLNTDLRPNILKPANDPTANPSRVSASVELQQQRYNFIQGLCQKGIFFKTDDRTVYVTAMFALADVDQKTAILGAFHAYALNIPRVPSNEDSRLYAAVYVKDSMSGKLLYTYSPARGLVAQ